MTATRFMMVACAFALLQLSGCGSESTTAPQNDSAAGSPSASANDSAESQSSIIGQWVLSIDTPRGVQNPLVTISETDGTLTGTYQSFRGPLDITSVTVEGNNFSFPLTITVPIGAIEVNYKGTIEGDRMTGLVMNPRGEVPFSGVRSGT